MDSAASPKREGASRYVLSVRFFLMPLFSVLCQMSRDFVVKITGSSNGSALTKSKYPYLTTPFQVASSISPSRTCLSYPFVPSLFSRFFAELAIHRLRLVVCFRVPSVWYRARQVQSRDRIDKNARSITSI